MSAPPDLVSAWRRVPELIEKLPYVASATLYTPQPTEAVFQPLLEGSRTNAKRIARAGYRLCGIQL